MRGRGSDQEGRWPVGIWFALVGVSAGTVASFALIGWTFTRGLYTADWAGDPVEIESGTVIIEGEEPPADPGGVDGLTGGEPAEPGAGIDPEPAKPQVERLPEPEAEPGPPVEEAAPSEEPTEEAEPPRLVPVEQGEQPCPEESGEEPEDGDGGGDDGEDGDGWDRPDWDHGHGHDEEGHWHQDHGTVPDLGLEPGLDLDRDLDLGLRLDLRES
ncbi:hypothetical protein GCM10009853_064680 [Glycomyces scopariae]